jgi:hypothetical protein
MSTLGGNPHFIRGKLDAHGRCSMSALGQGERQSKVLIAPKVLI